MMETTPYAKLRETLPGKLKFPCPRSSRSGCSTKDICDQIRGDIRRTFAGERTIDLQRQVVEQTVTYSGKEERCASVSTKPEVGAEDAPVRRN